MRPLICLSVLLILACDADGAEEFLFARTYASLDMNLVRSGTELTFSVESAGSDPVELKNHAPTFTCCSLGISNISYDIYKADSPDRFDWLGLERILAGSEAKATNWGPTGHTEQLPFLLTPGEGYFGNVKLTRLRFQFQRPNSLSFWVGSKILLYGYFTVVPEPASGVLLTVGLLGLFLSTRRSKK